MKKKYYLKFNLRLNRIYASRFIEKLFTWLSDYKPPSSSHLDVKYIQ